MIRSLRSQIFVTRAPHRILIVFWAPCFLFRSVICGNIRSTQHWSAFQGHGEKLILRADYHFCPAGLYFVIMIFLVHNIDRCSALPLILQFRDVNVGSLVCPERKVEHVRFKCIKDSKYLLSWLISIKSLDCPPTWDIRGDVFIPGCNEPQMWTTLSDL